MDRISTIKDSYNNELILNYSTFLNCGIIRYKVFLEVMMPKGIEIERIDVARGEDFFFGFELARTPQLCEIFGQDFEMDEKRALEIQKTCKIYNRELHSAVFCVPNFVKELANG